MNPFTTPPRRLTWLGLLLLALAAAPAPHAQILGTLESDDRFGEALASGDFDNDGLDDLAVGVHYEDVGTVLDAGAVNVIYGTASGLEEAGNQQWTQNSTGVGDVAETRDLFGIALAVGDFDDDGYDDLAIGATGEDYGSLTSVGQVHVLYGTVSGLTGSGSFYFPSVAGAQTGYRLGEALAAGDFDNDGYDDLAVGGPGRDLGTVTDAGLVAILFGSPSGVSATGYQVWHQNSPGIADQAETGDQFGTTLAVGYFDADSYADLAVGVPYENIRSIVDAGAVNVLYGAASGLASAGNQFWQQSTPGIEDLAETGDRFGWALATGNFDSVAGDDLAIGVPYEDVGTLADAGAVSVIYSLDGFTGDGPLDADGNEFWHQDVADVEGFAEAGDRFGAALAAGGFGFGCCSTDLAIGVPGEDDDGFTDIGYVYVIAGLLAAGLNPAADELWYQNTPGVLGTSDTDDAFGSALVGGRFDDVDFDVDLAIGVPGENLSGFSNNGAVNVFYSGASGAFTTAGNDFWYQGGTGTRLLVGGEGEDGEAAPEDISAAVTEAPAALALLLAAPNPFAGQTTLRFALPEAGAVRLAVYDTLGREVVHLVDAPLGAGHHAVAFDAGLLPSGTYLVRLEADGQMRTQRLTLAR